MEHVSWWRVVFYSGSGSRDRSARFITTTRYLSFLGHTTVIALLNSAHNLARWTRPRIR